MNNNIIHTTPEYSKDHCISADLKMSRGLAAQIKIKFGLWLSEAIPTNIGNRSVYYLLKNNVQKTMNKLHMIIISQFPI